MASRTVVGVVVVHPDGRVLIVKRGHPPLAGEWTLLGGTPKDGETLEDAARREVREEVGLAIDLHGEIEVVRIAGEGFDYLVHEILAVPAPPEQVLRAGDDAADAAWVWPSELDTYGVRQDAIAVIAHGVEALAARAR